jgi:hypothetical protein
MLEAQTIRRDSDLFDARPIENQASLIDQLRPYLTPQEVKLLGFAPANDAEERYTHLPAFLVGLGATASTTILFTVVAFLATLGLPETSIVAAAIA